MNESLANPLQTAARVGLLGDLHGDVQHLLLAMRSMWARDVDVLFALGDVGLVWPGENWNRALDKVARRLAAQGMTLYFLDGNHDWHAKINEFPLDDDGLRRPRPNILFAPRGYRTTLSSGRTLAVLGGANSIDRDYRVEGESWWPSESITEDDLSALGGEHADILLGHEAPLDIPQLDHLLAVQKLGWPRSVVQYAEEGRHFHSCTTRTLRPAQKAGHFAFNPHSGRAWSRCPPFGRRKTGIDPSFHSFRCPFS